MTARRSAPARPVVLHVNRVGFLGGAERVILTLASSLGGRARVILACPGGGDLESAALARGIEVAPVEVDRMRGTRNPLEFARYSLRWRVAAAQLRRVCAAHGVDIIHTHHPVGVLYARAAARALGIPIVFHLHDYAPGKRIYALALKVAARSANRIICVSEANRRFLLGTVDVDPDQVDVIHNGIDPLFLDRIGGAAPAPLGEGGPHIATFGALEPRKGHDVFLKAAARVIATHPGARFWIVGGAALADKSWYVDQLHALAKVPELRGAVQFTGFRSDVAELMKAMDVLALPSVEMESFSMVLVEALTLGCRTVGSDVGGTAEAITPERTGLVVPPGDPAALAQAINRMLGPDGALFAAAAAKEARARFAPGLFADRISDVYAKALGAGRLRSAA